MSHSVFVLSNSKGKSYTTDRSWKISISAWSPRTNVSDRYGKDGVSVFGDKRVGSRTITFNYILNNQNKNSLLETIQNINSVFDPDADHYYVTDTTLNRRMEVVLTSNDIQPVEEGTEYFTVRGNMNLRAVAPYWETTAVYSSGEVLSNNDTLTIANTSKYDVYPSIKVTCNTNQIDEWRLTNSSNNGNFIELINTSFTSGSVFNIDSVSGTITLQGVDSSASISNGGFIVLKPGDNVLTYTSSSSPVDVNVKWRNVESY